jgi:hypothetical protein
MPPHRTSEVTAFAMFCWMACGALALYAYLKLESWLLQEPERMSPDARLPAAPIPPDALYRETLPKKAEYRDEFQWGKLISLDRAMRFSEEQLSALEVTFENGVILKGGKPLDTRQSMTAGSGPGFENFVMMPSGRIYSFSYEPSIVSILLRGGHVQHSSAVPLDRSGEQLVDPAAGGEWMVHDGALPLLNDRSGHYAPTGRHSMQFLQELDRHGIRGFRIESLDVPPEQSTDRLAACTERAQALMKALAVQGPRATMPRTLALVGVSHPDDLKPLMDELRREGMLDQSGVTWAGMVAISNLLHGEDFQALAARSENLSAAEDVASDQPAATERMTQTPGPAGPSTTRAETPRPPRAVRAIHPSEVVRQAAVDRAFQPDRFALWSDDTLSEYIEALPKRPLQLLTMFALMGGGFDSVAAMRIFGLRHDEFADIVSDLEQRGLMAEGHLASDRIARLVIAGIPPEKRERAQEMVEQVRSMQRGIDEMLTLSIGDRPAR